MVAQNCEPEAALRKGTEELGCRLWHVWGVYKECLVCVLIHLVG